MAGEYMEEIEASVGQVYEIMQAVLLYSVTDVTRMQPQMLSLNSLVKEVEQSLLPLIEVNAAKIIFDELPVVEGDKIQLLRLFRNFIENSIERRSTKYH